jgi:hypothetical protein
MEMRVTEERKRTPLCSGADTGGVSKIDYMGGLRKQADFPLVFPTRKHEQPSYEAKQMTTAKAVGAASRMTMRAGAKRVSCRVDDSEL